MKRQYFKFLLLLIIFFSFFAASYNAFFNVHFHVADNGNIIFHAHPYAKSDVSPQPFQSHPHSKLQLLSYELITSLIFILIVIFIAFNLFAPNYYFHYFETDRISIIDFLSLPPQRGPPQFLFY